MRCGRSSRATPLQYRSYRAGVARVAYSRFPIVADFRGFAIRRPATLAHTAIDCAGAARPRTTPAQNRLYCTGVAHGRHIPCCLVSMLVRQGRQLDTQCHAHPAPTCAGHSGSNEARPHADKNRITLLTPKNKNPRIPRGSLAGVPGLEPRMAEPESAVLPITPHPNLAGVATQGVVRRTPNRI